MLRRVAGGGGVTSEVIDEQHDDVRLVPGIAESRRHRDRCEKRKNLQVSKEKKRSAIGGHTSCGVEGEGGRAGVR